MPLHMRTPKLRGFKNPFRVEYQVVNLDRLGAVPPGRHGGRRPARGQGRGSQNQPVKVLGDGEISVAVNVTAHKFSKSAAEKISAAGGSTTAL